MTVQKGALVLIKVGDGMVSESFATLGGLRTTSMILNNQLLDSSNADSGPWKLLQDNSGMRSLTISGSGIFTDSASEEKMRQNAYAGSVNNYQFFFANGNYLTGAFKVSVYERSGNHDAEENFSVVLESAGNIIFTAI